MAGVKYKDNKPEMEKKRRSRINESISCLKLLVLGEVRRKNTRISKLDKADILEMAVEYVQKMHMTANQFPETHVPIRHIPHNRSPAKIDRYRAGFNACAEEVRKHLADTAEVDIDLRTRVVDHLANFVQNLQWLRRHDILPYDVRHKVNERDSVSSFSMPLSKTEKHPVETKENAQESLGSFDGVNQVQSNVETNYPCSSHCRPINAEEEIGFDQFPWCQSRHSVGRSFQRRSEIENSSYYFVPKTLDICHTQSSQSEAVGVDYSLKAEDHDKHGYENCYTAQRKHLYCHSPTRSNNRKLGLKMTTDKTLQKPVDVGVNDAIPSNDSVRNENVGKRNRVNFDLPAESPPPPGGMDGHLHHMGNMWRPW